MSAGTTYQIVSLDAAVHERDPFDCGDAKLNLYLREQAAQDIKRKVAGCWVLSRQDAPNQVLGYYTLSSEAVDMGELGKAAPEVLKRLPRYPRLGAALLGRLAIALGSKKQGLGGLLLFDAMHRVLHAQIPVVFLLADPKDQKAQVFYLKFGFKRLNAERLFITMQQVASTHARRD